ncbi:Phospholipase/Carboxylesterase, putative [Angomonas deanei]|uniref:Phospholipase/Carboxylesterase, putative n=1 Tax=Angomonas deanei TaxID=59799 RepID=A0A7G2CTA2_9TRYP|nr:Phospholipase/Carboxylesterase, putative [Angomonas deanei]
MSGIDTSADALGPAIGSLSNTQIKEELKSRYGITDFSDCIEPGDLQARLSNTRNSRPITHGLRYGELLEIGNQKNPTGLVTVSHGLGDSCRGWEDVGHDLARRFPYLLFLLPTAPNRAITINGGMTMPAWYDINNMITSGLASGRQDTVGVMQSADYIRSLAHVTARRYNVPLSRVVYAGFSQGAATSLVTGLTGHLAPAGVAVLSGYFASMTDVIPQIRHRHFPLHFFHGTADPVVPYEAATETVNVLKKELGREDIGLTSYPNMQHQLNQKELNDLATFIGSCLPEKFSAL